MSESSDEGRGSYSRDGRWIYFRSDRSGRNEIWKMPAEGGAARQVTRNGAMEGFESPDGKLLYFVRERPELGLWSVPVGGGQEARVTDGVRDTRWAVSRDGIRYVTVRAPYEVMLYRYESGKTESIHRIPSGTSVWSGFSASFEGDVLVWPQTVRDSSDIAILDGVR
jgi:Tol biopolymer transport system component